jgi:hypothetical protein
MKTIEQLQADAGEHNRTLRYWLFLHHEGKDLQDQIPNYEFMTFINKKANEFEKESGFRPIHKQHEFDQFLYKQLVGKFVSLWGDTDE